MKSVVTTTFVTVVTNYLMEQRNNLQIAIGTGQDTWDSSLPDLSPSIGGLFHEVARKTIQSIKFLDPLTQQEVNYPTTMLEIASAEFTESDYSGDIRECALYLNTPLGLRMLLCSVFNKITLEGGTVFTKTYRIDPS